MSAGFDPLYQWLGIPPEEQPPHCYRLLGLRVFEEDFETIGNAADRQTAFLESLQTGADAEIARQLLGQVATARAWLLDPANKAQYDAWLRQQLAPPPVEAPPVDGVAPETEEAGPDLSDVLSGSDAYVESRRRIEKRFSRRWLGMMISLAAGVLALGAVCLVALKLQDSLSETGTLVVEWPQEERRDGTLEVDGTRVGLAAGGEIVLSLPMGAHEVKCTRPGYLPYEVTMGVTTGKTTTVRPVWREEGEKTEDERTEPPGEPKNPDTKAP